jgi:hypothetical protein
MPVQPRGLTARLPALGELRRRLQALVPPHGLCDSGGEGLA